MNRTKGEYEEKIQVMKKTQNLNYHGKKVWYINNHNKCISTSKRLSLDLKNSNYILFVRYSKQLLNILR